MMQYTVSNLMRLTPAAVIAIADALVGIGWMTNSMSEWNRKSTTAISALMDCSAQDAECIWRYLRDQNFIDLRSESNLSDSGSMEARWMWCKREETFA